MLEEQLVTTGEDEHFIAVFYGEEADENVFPQEREVVASYFSPSVKPRVCRGSTEISCCVFLLLWLTVYF